MDIRQKALWGQLNNLNNTGYLDTQFEHAFPYLTLSKLLLEYLKRLQSVSQISFFSSHLVII